MASWVADPDTADDERGELRPALSIFVLLATLGLMTLPALIGVLVLLGGIS